MSAFKIETGVPLPPSNAGMWTMRAFGMKVGHSALLADWHEAKCLTRGLTRVGSKFVCRKISGEGVRVWRIA